MSSSAKSVFNHSGPHFLTYVDWNNTDHKRVVMASLAKGVSVMERDRHEERHGSDALALPWWEFFGFEVFHVFEDRGTIFGAVYKHVSSRISATGNGPIYVVAFRGMVRKPVQTVARDLLQNMQCVIHTLHESSSFNDSIQTIRDLVAKATAPNVWLVGYSLGSAVAMLAGKEMAMLGFPLETTYLFNPPCVSAPIEWIIKSSKVKLGLRIFSSTTKVGMALALKAFANTPLEDTKFMALAAWVPNIFVNPHDPLCSGYIGYFEHRRKMESIGAGEIEKIATQKSVRSLIAETFGTDSKPLEILPCAHLTTNLNGPKEFMKAHGIAQWWDPRTQCGSTTYLLYK